MGNCCRYCNRKNDKRNYLRTRYNVEREMSVEFENLVDNDTCTTDPLQYGSAMTDYERQMLSERKFHDLVQYQIKIDAEIEAQLIRQEEQLRHEEEAFIEAKRLATQVGSKPSTSRSKPGAHSDHVKDSVVSDDNWEMAAGEEDFDEFLQTTQTKTLNRKSKEASIEVDNCTPQSTTQPDLLAASAALSSSELRDKQSVVDSDWNADFVSADSDG